MTIFLAHTIGRGDRRLPTAIDTKHIVFVQEHAYGCRVGLTNLPMALLLEEDFEFVVDLLVRDETNESDLIESRTHGSSFEEWMGARSDKLSDLVFDDNPEKGCSL